MGHLAGNSSTRANGRPQGQPTDRRLRDGKPHGADKAARQRTWHGGALVGVVVFCVLSFLTTSGERLMTWSWAATDAPTCAPVGERSWCALCATLRVLAPSIGRRVVECCTGQITDGPVTGGPVRGTPRDRCSSRRHACVPEWNHNWSYNGQRSGMFYASFCRQRESQRPGG